MKSIMTKIPIWLLMAWPYIFIGGLFAGGGSLFGIFCILTVILCVANIVNACTYKTENVARELGLWGMATKLVHMPFYVVAVVMGLMGIIAMSADPSIGNSLVILLFMFMMAVVVMVQSSVYCTKAIFAAQEKGIAKKESAMMFAATSFIMFADVICAILIYNKIKKNKKCLHK